MSHEPIRVRLKTCEVALHVPASRKEDWLATPPEKHVRRLKPPSLLLVVRPGAPSSVLAPKALRQYTKSD